MYYPMRVVRTPKYRFIHNINHYAPYPLPDGLFQTPTFQRIVNLTLEVEPTGWFKTLHQYYYRDQFELYDLRKVRRCNVIHLVMVMMTGWVALLQQRCYDYEHLV
jgi:hypothetical protein